MLKLSLKDKKLVESPIRKLIPYANIAKQNGVNVLHLNIGQPDIDSPVESMEIVKNNTLKLLPYGPSEGSISYREALCRYYKQNKINVTPENIIVTTGASEALAITLNCVCDPGDQIIIPEPFYANYSGFASAASIEIVPIKLFFEDNFKLPSSEDIESKITAKTKAILICNPSNPTGYLYTKQELEVLGKIALKNDVFIIVDEVYREFIHDDKQKHYSILEFEKIAKNSIMIDSVSKRYSLCGARVGCMVSKNKNLISTALKFAQLRLSPPTYALMASEAALNASKSYVAKVKKEYTLRRNVLIDAIKKIDGVKVSKPKGAFYCIAELPVENAENFSRWLLTDFSFENETAMFAPASGFYSTPGYGKNQIRIGFVLNTNKIIRAIKILEKGLSKYNNLR